MNKTNFLSVFSHDSATEELCAAMVMNYKKAAKEASEKSGLILMILKATNPTIDIPWHYRALQKKSNPDKHGTKQLTVSVSNDIKTTRNELSK